LKENEWQCDLCRKINTYSAYLKISGQCECGYTNKAIKELIFQHNEIDLVNQQREMMSIPSKKQQEPRKPVQKINALLQKCPNCKENTCKIGNKLCDDCYYAAKKS
jgi:hypothetical protein